MQTFKFSIGICVCALAFAAVVRADDNPDQAAARAAVLAQLAQMDAAPPATNVIVATPPPTQAPIVVAPVAPVAPVLSQPAPVTVPALNDVAVQSRAVAATVQTNAVVKISVTNAPAATNFLPLIAPALPISDSKEARLQALDAQYKSGQISPQNYFNQREAILNGN
jgi:hypothetical protein